MGLNAEKQSLEDKMDECWRKIQDLKQKVTGLEKRAQHQKK